MDFSSSIQNFNYFPLHRELFFVLFPEQHFPLASAAPFLYTYCSGERRVRRRKMWNDEQAEQRERQQQEKKVERGKFSQLREGWRMKSLWNEIKRWGRRGVRRGREVREEWEWRRCCRYFLNSASNIKPKLLWRFIYREKIFLENVHSSSHISLTLITMIACLWVAVAAAERERESDGKENY